jgi:hypothetical protein
MSVPFIPLWFLMVRHYSMPSEPAMDVTAGEPDTGTEAGLALVVVGSSSTSRIYSDSAKSLPLTNAESRGTENAWARILCGVRSERVAATSPSRLCRLENEIETRYLTDRLADGKIVIESTSCKAKVNRRRYNRVENRRKDATLLGNVNVL